MFDGLHKGQSTSYITTMRNPYLKDFRSQMRMRFAEDSEAMSYSEWIIKNTTLKKKPFSFVGYEFQRQIIDDMHPNMFVKKISQIGLTEVQLRKFAGFLSRNTGVKGIFTLPDDMMFKRVSQTRFKPIMDNDKVFNLGSVEKPIRSIPLYQIGQSFGYFVGNKESDATSIDADLLFHDELDLSNQEMIALFQSRLQGSEHRITQNFSTPTFEGFGIDAGFNISDQHEYMCKCSKCNHYNLPAFNPRFVHFEGLTSDTNDFIDIDDKLAEGINLEKSFIHCENCRTPLVLNNPEMRQWVPRFPGRRIRGYQITPFATSRLSLTYILEQMLQYKRRDATRRFYNTVLGQAYNDSNARLSELEIRAVMEGPSEQTPSGGDAVFIGIDVGQTCHVTLFNNESGTPIAFSWKQVASGNLVNEVKVLMKRYNIIAGAIDRYPYTPLSEEIRDLTEGKIMPFEYSTTANAAAIQIIKDELDNNSHIRINRTTAIDQFATAIRKRKTRFYGYGQHEHLLIQHLRDMVRIEKDDLSAMWQKLTGNDHFFHSGTLGYYSIRVAQALNYRSDADARQMVSVGNLTATIQSGSELDMKSRRSTPISLGTL